VHIQFGESQRDGHQELAAVGELLFVRVIVRLHEVLFAPVHEPGDVRRQFAEARVLPIVDAERHHSHAVLHLTNRPGHLRDLLREGAGILGPGLAGQPWLLQDLPDLALPDRMADGWAERGKGTRVGWPAASE